MKRLFRSWWRALGVAALLGLSPVASAQSVFCDGVTCFYGPICPDAWGGCYFYSWSIGSAKNEWTQTGGGVANVLGLCNPNNPGSCFSVTANVETIKDQGGTNAVIQCQVPGSETCTDKQCGGSPGSGGKPFTVFLQTQFAQSSATTLDASSCTKDETTTGGALNCSKSSTLEGLKGDANAAAQFCPNKNWKISQWWPLNFVATVTATGPQSRENQTPVSEVSKSQCWLRDPQGNFPHQQGYQLSSNLKENKLHCQIIP